MSRKISFFRVFPFNTEVNHAFFVLNESQLKALRPSEISDLVDLGQFSEEARGLYLTRSMSRKILYQVAFNEEGEIDFAIPRGATLDPEKTAEFGAVWFYQKGDHFGRPRYDLDVWRRLAREIAYCYNNKVGKIILGG